MHSDYPIPIKDIFPERKNSPLPVTGVIYNRQRPGSSSADGARPRICCTQSPIPRHKLHWISSNQGRGI